MCRLGILLVLLAGPSLAGHAERSPTPLAINAAPVATSKSVTVQLAANGTGTLVASSVNNGSTGTAPLTYTIQKIAYGQVAENATLTLTAPTGATFSAITYASYGTSTGTNGNYTVGACNGTNSASVVGTYLLGKGTGSIPATNGVFGDPCVGTLKNLSVVAAFSANATTQAYTCADAATSYVLLTVTDGSGATSTTTAQVTVLAPPTATLTAASPSTGTVGNTITLSGTNLSGATSVTVNSKVTTIASASASALTFQVPAGATSGAGSIVVALPCSQSLSIPFTVSADLVVNANQTIPAGIYNTITINKPAVATLGSDVVVNGNLTVTEGATLNDGCNVLSGTGTFTLAAGGTLGICAAQGISTSGATGAVQTTGTRSFNTDALYTYQGTEAQVTGTGLPGTVRTLALANSTGLTLTNSLTVVTAATLTTGVLTTGANVLTLSSTATIGETLAGYVTGTVKTTRTLGTAGTSESFGGLGVTLTPSGAILPGSTTVTRVTGTAQSGVGTSQSIKRYFDIQPAVNVGLNVALALTARDDERNGIAPANLRLFKSSTGGTTWQPQAGATYGTATSGGLTTYSASASNLPSLGRFTLGSAANPLPVQLAGFTAQAQGGAVALAWRTASEQNSARFEVERSTDGLRFAQVGSVPAAGTSLTPRAYELLDGKLPAGAALLYYRLRQVDLDGTAAYSGVQSVAVAATGLALYPNPAGRTTTLSGVTAGALVHVYDVVGSLVLTAAADEAGTAALTLPATLPGGLYLVRTGTAPALRLTVE